MRLTWMIVCFVGVGLGRPHIEITVSPLATETFIRILDILWNCGSHWRPGDWVALYNKPPKFKTDISLYSNVAETYRGWLRTGIQENRTFPVVAQFERRCLGYWAAYWSKFQDEPMAITCLMTNPTWMEDNWEDVKNLKLNEIFLPGSHDAGSYRFHYQPFNPGKYNKYIYNQDEPILEQLIHGSRFLDLRVAHFRTSGYWINHQIVRTHVFKFVLDDILLFLDETREILVIDLHGFPIGFRSQPAKHDELVELLKDYLGEHIAPYTGYDTTLQEIMDAGKRLIIAHNKPLISCQYPKLLWRPVIQKWGNVYEIKDLKDFLAKEIDKPHGKDMWAAMAELTPGTWNVVTDRLDGLRAMMDTCNHNVTEWFRDEWGMAANVVAVDFVRSTGIVSAAIRWNKEKGRRKRYEPKQLQTFRKLGKSEIATGSSRLVAAKYSECISELTQEYPVQKPWWDLGRRNLQTPNYPNQSPIIFYPGETIPDMR